MGNGTVWKRWSACKAEWFKLNDKDYYFCHYCGKSLPKNMITLDHKIARSRRPELRYDFNNLVPSCWVCNGLKGSIDHDDFPHACP